MKGYEIFNRTMKDLGINKIFGNPGDRGGRIAHVHSPNALDNIKVQTSRKDTCLE